MPDSNLMPSPPRQSPFGWPLPDRREEFTKLLAAAGGDTHRVENFKGAMVALKIIRVPINLPKYRIANGRTASAQQEWTATHGEALDFFDAGDPEMEIVQSAQHSILKGMIREEGLLDKFKDATQRQVEPILLDENGFVVNGNRRLCCWRELYSSEAATYSHFSHIDAVVLPHCDEQELDRLEARLQIERDIRSDYSWDAEANMLLQKQRLHGFKTKEIAKLYGKKKGEIDELFGMREMAAEYLHSRGKDNTWSLVRGDKFAFRELYKAVAATNSSTDRELIKQASFALIDNPDEAGERLYAVIPKVKEHLTKIKQDLAQAFPVQPVQPDSDAEAAFGGQSTLPGFADGKTPDLALVAEVKTNDASKEKARRIVIETIRSQEEQKEELKQADFLLKTLKKANTLIQSAAAHGLKPESSLQGVNAQIKAIQQALKQIDNWLAEKQT